MRNDALNFDAISLENGQKLFLTGSSRDLFENVFDFDRHNISSAWQAPLFGKVKENRL